ncbi:hypothetical protein SLE2022_130160 [Rubroshorea leprosula]
MASLILFRIPNLPKLAAISRNPRVVLTAGPRLIQASYSHQKASEACENAKDAAKQGAGEAMKVGQDIKEKTASTASQMSMKTKDMAGKASDTAQEMTSKAKQTMQDAWDSAKETAQKAKDTVMGKAEDSKEAIKQNADQVKRSMNSKN